MPRKSPEEKAADLLRQGKAVFTQRTWDPQVPTVREAFRSLPEWFARRGGVFAWDESKTTESDDVDMQEERLAAHQCFDV